MKFDGKDGVLTHYLMDVDNRLGDLTLPSYTHRLGALVHLLHDLCSVTDLERVEIKHLRLCLQHLLTVPVDQKGRITESGDGILAISTVRGYIRVWKAFFSWCYQEELIDSNPADRLKAPKEEKRIKPAFTQEHIDKMLATCDTGTPFGFRDYVILLLLLDTGMRISELAGLRIEDVNFQGSCVKVFGKGRREREIGIYPEMSKLIWKYIQKRRKSSDDSERALFLGLRGPLGSHGIECIIKRIQVKSGLTDIELHAHVFRHTFAKMYLDRGGELFKLSREMGHSDVRTTKIYLEDFGSTEARKDHNSYSPLAGIQFKKGRKR
jgi:integrase/recombinase XerD